MSYMQDASDVTVQGQSTSNNMQYFQNKASNLGMGGAYLGSDGHTVYAVDPNYGKSILGQYGNIGTDVQPQSLFPLSGTGSAVIGPGFSPFDFSNPSTILLWLLGAYAVYELTKHHKRGED